MPEKWQPDPVLAKLIAYANEHGVSSLLIRARLLQIFLSDNNQMAALKAGEMLREMGDDGGDGVGDDINPDVAMRMAQLIDRFMQGDDDLYTILAGIDETEATSYPGDGFPQLPGLRQNDHP